MIALNRAARLAATHHIHITEHANAATGVITYDWSCSCPFAFGFGLPTYEEAQQAANWHAPVKQPHVRSATPLRIVATNPRSR